MNITAAMNSVEFWKNAYIEKLKEIENYQAQLESKKYGDYMNEVIYLRQLLQTKTDDLKKSHEYIADLKKENEYLNKELTEQMEAKAAYKHKYEIAYDYGKGNLEQIKQQQEQIETLRFDNEHLQKDIAEKDLQIAALKDRLYEYEKPFAWPPIYWGEDLKQYKAKTEDLKRQLDVYEKLFEPIMEYAKTRDKNMT